LKRRTIGNGGGITGIIGEGGKVEITSSSMIDGCEAGGGNGGGMYLTQNGNGKINMTRVEVKKCQGKNVDGKGG
jgi:hypothetical protein